MPTKLRSLFLIPVLTALVGCSSINLNPFGSSAKELSLTPQNSTEYVCEGNKIFYVRILNNGSDAWLIYPDHEVNLSKAADGGNRYTSGAITLAINGAETTLNDGEKIAYTACKPQVKSEK